jgi:Xaa-Pro aminopeptidase
MKTKLITTALGLVLGALIPLPAAEITPIVDAAARKVLKGYGLDRAFIHSTGHGLGLEIHEPPRLGKRDRHRLRTGMAITIEPRRDGKAYQGIVELSPAGIAASAETYFAQSEQLPTVVRLAAAPVYTPGAPFPASLRPV